MRKLLYFVPALTFTVFPLCLNLIMRALLPLWHIWNILFWFSGWQMSRGRARVGQVTIFSVAFLFIKPDKKSETRLDIPERHDIISYGKQNKKLIYAHNWLSVSTSCRNS